MLINFLFNHTPLAPYGDLLNGPHPYCESARPYRFPRALRFYQKHPTAFATKAPVTQLFHQICVCSLYSDHNSRL
ncbi:hypothetical protein ACTXT7_003664 [Hymenolepis weldensis]